MIRFKIEQELAELSSTKYNAKRLTVTSWNGSTPKLDLRNWRTDEAEPQPCKGITLTVPEAQALTAALSDYLQTVKP